MAGEAGRREEEENFCCSGDREETEELICCRGGRVARVRRQGGRAAGSGQGRGGRGEVEMTGRVAGHDLR